MKRLGTVLIAIALVVYAAICGTLYATQRALLYYPTPESKSAHARALRVATDGAVLKVWHLASSGERAILYFGGNAEDVGSNIDAFGIAFPDTDVYLVNYRGYGGSTGEPSESGFLRDAERLFDEIRSRHPRVAVIGRSLGSGVAVHLASVRDVSKLALVSPYDSITRVAQRQFPLVPVSWLLRDTFDSVGKAAKVRAPVLVLLAERDQVIPRAHSERLATAFAPGRVEMRAIAGTDHDSIGASPEYHSTLAAFLLY
jgi:pimeloyl-ACP methyl ester carboxylesterase